jgi:hypothetical protein
MSKPTNQKTLNEVRAMYDDNWTITMIAHKKHCSPAWIWNLLRRTGTTRPRGYNLRKPPTLAAVEQGEKGAGE